MSSVAFLTTVFPQNLKYLKYFFDSLSNQTRLDFDLVVINDGLKSLDYFKNKYQNLNIIEISSSLSIAKNREVGINYCIEKEYKKLIFGDSDDYFQNDRVKISLDLLNDSDIVVNDLSLFNHLGVYEKNYFSNRLNNYDQINFEFIKNKNIFGLSNTAINLNNIEKVKFPDNAVAVDWLFFQSLLKKGLKSIFTNDTISYYRQHKENIAGLQSENGKYLLWWEKSENTINKK